MDGRMTGIEDRASRRGDKNEGNREIGKKSARQTDR